MTPYHNKINTKVQQVSGMRNSQGKYGEHFLMHNCLHERCWNCCCCCCCSWLSTRISKFLRSM